MRLRADTRCSAKDPETTPHVPEMDGATTNSVEKFHAGQNSILDKFQKFPMEKFLDHKFLWSRGSRRKIDAGYVGTLYGCSIYLFDVIRFDVIGPSDYHSTYST